LRRIGTRGGRAHARNWGLRQRTAQAATGPIARSQQQPVETTAQAIATLDAQFPCLCRAELDALRR
jgi:predicted short-subunit dehydrogenase-like oxidoreductase (DUF2520 family)